MLILAEAFGLAFLACLSTNLDNLLLVLAGGSADRARADAASFAAVLGVAIGLSLVLSLGVDRLAVPGLLRWVGLVPIGLGLYELLRRSPSPPDGAGSALPRGALATTLAANSLDTLAVQTVLFADYAGRYHGAGLLGSAAAALLLTAAAAVLLSRRGPFSRLLALAARARPWILIAVGALILLDTGFDTL